MMNLSANMDLKNIKDNILAKANNGNELFYPPDKPGGNAKSGGNAN